MFVDELEIQAKAGNGGDGVVRWKHEKFKPRGGPAGGNGGNGGDVYLIAVPDLSLLAKYRGSKEFEAENGEAGSGNSKHGKGGEDLYIKVPSGSTVTDLNRKRTYKLFEVGQKEKVLLGGPGGLGNEYFKSSTNRAPKNATKGKAGERGTFLIELSLVVDVGLAGLPNAGKSTLLNTLTNAGSKIGSYPFTTVEPHLGSLYGITIADIPGLIEGASSGKGLGHKFLRHVSRTKMLLHCVSIEEDNPMGNYNTVRNEIGNFEKELLEREEWVILTKTDTATEEEKDAVKKQFEEQGKKVYTVSAVTGDGIKVLKDDITKSLQAKEGA